MHISTDCIRVRGIGHLKQRVPLSFRPPSRGEQALVWYELEYSPTQNPLPRLSLGMADESELSNATLAGLAQFEITIEDRDRPIRLSARQLLGYNASDQGVEFFPGVVDSIATWYPDRPEAAYTLSAELSSRGILEPHHHRSFSFRGTVEPIGGLEPFPGLTWMGRNGHPFSLQLDFEHSRGSGESGMHADILLERPRALCRLRAPASSDHAVLLNELEHELADVLPLFSLLSRRPIWCRRLLIESMTVGEWHEAWSSFRLNGSEPKHAPEAPSYWPLVHARQLAEHNAFEQLVAAIRSAPERESLLRAASLLTATYVEQNWETAYALSMAALEALLDGFEETQPKVVPISDAEWKRVASSVRNALQSCAHSGDLSAEQLESVLGKVLELRRPPLKPVIQHHVARLKVRVDDLWASRESFEKGIAGALTQRNKLLHAGKIESPEEALGNLWRIRIFVERFILRAIEFPDALFASAHNQGIVRANLDCDIRRNPKKYPTSSWMLVPKRWRRSPRQTSEGPSESEAQTPEEGSGREAGEE